MQLYDHPVSPNCRKVRVYCAEKGLHVALRPVALLDSEQRTPEFLQRNPFGAIPILELDDGTIVPESLAIIEYLEELHPSPPLLGDDPLTRALVRAWEHRARWEAGAVEEEGGFDSPSAAQSMASLVLGGRLTKRYRQMTSTAKGPAWMYHGGRGTEQP